MTAALVMVVAALALGARTVTVCEDDVGCLVLAGDRFTDADQVEIPVVPGDGYDAQFFYRQARSPFSWELAPSDGVRFDTPARVGRVGYPLAVWGLSGGGRPAAVPWAMVVVGVLSLGAIGAVLTLAALQADRSWWWGAVATAIPGLWFASGRALADPFSAALVGAAALALGRRRWWPAAALFACAALTKEQAVIVPLAYGLVRIWQLLSSRGATDRPSASTSRLEPFGADLPWLAPAAVFLAWQGALLVATGSLPAAEAGGSNVVAPFLDLVPAVWGWLTPSGLSEVLWLLELLVFVGLTLVVVSTSTAFVWERLVAGLALLFVLALNDNVFVDPAHFRQMGDLTVVLIIAAFRAPRRFWAPLLATNAAVTAGVIGRLLSGL